MACQNSGTASLLTGFDLRSDQANMVYTHRMADVYDFRDASRIELVDRP